MILSKVNSWKIVFKNPRTIWWVVCWPASLFKLTILEWSVDIEQWRVRWINALYVFSEKQMNNEDIFPQYDDAIHDPKSPEDSSSQKSEYYCELAEIESNDIAAEEVYEQIWFNHFYEFLLTRYGFIWPSRYSTKFMICFCFVFIILFCYASWLKLL